MGSGLEQNEKSPTKKQTIKSNFVKEASPAKTAHDWRKYSNREGLGSDGISPVEVEFYDDGTVTFFWRAHTLTVLFLMIAALIYVAVFEPVILDTQYNTKRGLVACVIVFILLCVTVTPNGPFKRPHPALWRFTFSLSIVYELVLIFVLFQTADDARKLLKHFDSKLGEPLAERSYGGSCVIYDETVPENPWHNVLDKFDAFVPTHFFGWWLKTLILRDWWLCTIISIMFEVLEYTLEHQLPNFSECWWDHWIMDALLCNGLGIIIGIQTLKYFSMKTYYWRGLWNIPSYRGKLKRMIAQFGPYNWVQFEWRPLSSLGRWCATLGIMFIFLLTELNTFYLKFVLWVPPDHWLNLVRLFLVLLWGAVGLRETFQYFDDPDCENFGRQSWVILAIVVTEFLIVARFDWETITKPLPWHVVLFWSIFFLMLVTWTVFRFFIASNLQKNADRWLEEQRRRLLWLRAKSIELGIYSPESNERLENPNEASHLENTSDNMPRSSSMATKPKKRRAHKAD
ncbi:phosphatidylserine synthase 2 [Daphnia magna]|uniref:phosphatidylserine synthase 2 n=1 Tax=Daphnia magna TaxID=35525 RepID=UPI001E1BAF69|nr:phosphatidylserine synthase 2 [Daphnia magna]